MTDPRNETDPLPNGWTWEQAIEAACERTGDNAEYITKWYGWHSPAGRALNELARLIAQHEKPPVDEAAQVWNRAFEAWSTRTHENAIAIIRDALAKARAGK